MAVKSEQIEKNLVKLTFEVSAENFEKAVQQAYLKNKNKINVKGFRKGKAPRAVIEKEYGVGVFYDEAINAVLPEAYEAAAKESGADIVARPEIDVEDIKKGENVVLLKTVLLKTVTSQLSTLKVLLTVLHLKAAKVQIISLKSVQTHSFRVLRTLWLVCKSVLKAT